MSRELHRVVCAQNAPLLPARLLPAALSQPPQVSNHRAPPNPEHRQNSLGSIRLNGSLAIFSLRLSVSMIPFTHGHYSSRVRRYAACLISPVSTRRTFDVRFRELSRTSPPNNPHNKSPRERQRAAASLLAACPLRIRPSISTARTGTSLAGMPKIMASKLVSLRSLGRSAIPHLCVCLFG